MDKEWDQKYIGNPASHRSSSSRSSRSAQAKAKDATTSPRDDNSQLPQQQPKTLPIRTTTPQKNGSSSPTTSNSIITPPSSASPSRREFHPSNPFSPLHSPTTTSSQLQSPPTSPQRGVQRSPSVATSSQPPPYSKANPSKQRHNPNRSNSAESADNPRSLLDETQSRQRSSNATNGDKTARRPTQTTHRHSRNRSLNERFPGDMSHRPLDVIKREARAADRTPHRRHRRGVSNTDTIDNLDTVGGTYHHDGPYEATLASRNTNSLYSPVAAVRESNMEALRATPREYIEDSLQRHVPLQGTSTVPSGGVDFNGDVITYEEGADLMREPDAAGGAYKRWDGVRYHPDDLKGKGEPSYTLERDLKLKKGLLHPGQQPGDLEMQPRTSMRLGGTRQRSSSNIEGAAAASSGFYRDGLGEDAEGINRSNSTGKRLSEGLKRRFGSIRRKKNASVSVLE